MFRSAFSIIILSLMTACATLPATELAAYSQNVTAAKTAGDDILDLVVPTLSPPNSRSQVEECQRNEQGVRPCFRVDFALGTSSARINEPTDIQVRRLALETLETYTQMLVAIAEGRPAAVVRQRSDQLSEIHSQFQTTLAGFGSIAELTFPIASITTVVEKLVEAGAQTASVLSVVEAEPGIRALIQLLIDDTPTLYRAFRSQFIGDRGDLVLAIRRAELSGNPEEAARLQRQLDAVRSGAGQAVQLRQFEDALTSYVRILDATDKALVVLRNAITLESLGPVDRLAEFARRSAETRVWLNDLEEDLRAIRAELRG